MPFFCQLIPEPIGGGEGEEIGQHSGFFRQLKFIKTLFSGRNSLVERQSAAVSSLLCSSLCSLIYQRILSFFNFWCCCCCCWWCFCLVHLFAHRWPPKCGTSFAFKMFSPAQFQPAQLWPFIWHISLCLPIAAAVARAALSGSSGSPQCLFVFAKLIFLLLFLLFLFSPLLSLSLSISITTSMMG